MKHSGRNVRGGKRLSKKSRRWLPAVLIGLLVVIVVVGVVIWVTQRNNLKAMYLATTTDKTVLEQMQQEEDKKRDEILEEYGLQKPDTSQTGEATPSPAASPGSDPTTSPTGEATPTPGASASPQPTNQPEQTTPPAQEPPGTSDEPQDEQAQLQAQLQEKVNELYAVEATFRGMVDSVVAQAKAEFVALPKDQRNESNKMAIVTSKAGTLMAQEQQCDAQVSAIVADIRSILQQMGKSTALADEVNSYYENSKANWKAMMMAELLS